jgi:hypothetical protein
MKVTSDLQTLRWPGVLGAMGLVTIGLAALSACVSRKSNDQSRPNEVVVYEQLNGLVRLFPHSSDSNLICGCSATRKDGNIQCITKVVVSRDCINRDLFQRTLTGILEEKMDRSARESTEREYAFQLRLARQNWENLTAEESNFHTLPKSIRDSTAQTLKTQLEKAQYQYDHWKEIDETLSDLHQNLIASVGTLLDLIQDSGLNIDLYSLSKNDDQVTGKWLRLQGYLFAAWQQSVKELSNPTALAEKALSDALSMIGFSFTVHTARLIGTSAESRNLVLVHPRALGNPEKFSTDSPAAGMTGQPNPSDGLGNSWGYQRRTFDQFKQVLDDTGPACLFGLASFSQQAVEVGGRYRYERDAPAAGYPDLTFLARSLDGKADLVVSCGFAESYGIGSGKNSKAKMSPLISHVGLSETQMIGDQRAEFKFEYLTTLLSDFRLETTSDGHKNRSGD